ncbi:MAG: hypothetical protein HY698_19540 [Deltaproteobacteria bacterium]|nr:hypothetical protein [Deltaproteobacteria bacterium]
MRMKAALWGALALLAACTFDPSGLQDDTENVVPSQVDGGGAAFLDSGSIVDRGSDSAAPDARAPRSDAGTARPDAAPPESEGVVHACALSPEHVPILDGRLGDWRNVHWITFSAENAGQVDVFAPDYRPSLLVALAACYTKRSLYFAVRVFDDQVVLDSSEPYEDDLVALFLDMEGDRSGPPGADDHVFWVTPEGACGRLASRGPNIDCAATRVSGGYLLEARVDVSPTFPSIGFNVGASDDDGLANHPPLSMGAADAFVLWYVPDTPACQECCTEDVYSHDPQPWCDTTRMGVMVFDP